MAPRRVALTGAVAYNLVWSVSKCYDLLLRFFFFNVIKGQELVPEVAGVA